MGAIAGKIAGGVGKLAKGAKKIGAKAKKIGAKAQAFGDKVASKSLSSKMEGKRFSDKMQGKRFSDKLNAAKEKRTQAMTNSAEGINNQIGTKNAGLNPNAQTGGGFGTTNPSPDRTDMTSNAMSAFMRKRGY